MRDANSGKTILIVDDVEDWQITLSGLMEDEGHTVVAVGSAGAAQEAAQGQKFDLAIIDIRLDETDEANEDGLDLAGSLKKIQENLPIIIITGYQTPGSIERAMKPDETEKILADGFVLKMDSDELLDIVHELLGQDQIHQETS